MSWIIRKYRYNIDATVRIDIHHTDTKSSPSPAESLHPGAFRQRVICTAASGVFNVSGEESLMTVHSYLPVHLEFMMV